MYANLSIQNRELNALMPKMNELASTRISEQSTTQKILMVALPVLCLITIASTPIWIGYAAITFTATPIVLSAFEWGILFAVNQCADLDNQILLQMKVIAVVGKSFVNRPILYPKIIPDLLKFEVSLLPFLKPQVREMAQAFCALVCMQNALNQLGHAIIKFKAAKSTNSDAEIARLNAVAKEALDILHSNVKLIVVDNLYGINAKHISVLKYLANITEQQIKMLDFRESNVSMIDYTDTFGVQVDGLSSLIT